MNCGLLENVNLLYITQYLVGVPFALITDSIRHGMGVISLWHCWGGMESQVSLTVAFSSSAFFGLLFLIFLLTIPHRLSMGFRSGEFAGQSSTPTPWSSKNTMDQHQQMTLHPNHHRLWKLNTGLQATWAISFSLFLQTLGHWFPNKIQNLLSSEKRTLDHCATVQFSLPLPR